MQALTKYMSFSTFYDNLSDSRSKEQFRSLKQNSIT